LEVREGWKFILSNPVVIVGLQITSDHGGCQSKDWDLLTDKPQLIYISFGGQGRLEIYSGQFCNYREGCRVPQTMVDARVNTPRNK